MDEKKQAWARYEAMLLYDGGPSITSAGDTAILDYVHMGGVGQLPTDPFISLYSWR